MPPPITRKRLPERRTQFLKRANIRFRWASQQKAYGVDRDLRLVGQGRFGVALICGYDGQIGDAYGVEHVERFATLRLPSSWP